MKRSWAIFKKPCRLAVSLLWEEPIKFLVDHTQMAKWAVILDFCCNIFRWKAFKKSCNSLCLMKGVSVADFVGGRGRGGRPALAPWEVQWAPFCYIRYPFDWFAPLPGNVKSATEVFGIPGHTNAKMTGAILMMKMMTCYMWTMVCNIQLLTKRLSLQILSDRR